MRTWIIAHYRTSCPLILNTEGAWMFTNSTRIHGGNWRALVLAGAFCLRQAEVLLDKVAGVKFTDVRIYQ
jgi:hypothetical protein